MTLETQSVEKPEEVAISRSLVARIERRLPNTEFKSVDEYVSYVLEQILSEIGNQEKKAELDNNDPFLLKEDEEVLEQRLKDLGYI